MFHYRIERLIEEVQARECLWNSDSLVYLNKERKREAWVEVFEAMEANPEQLSPTEKEYRIEEIRKKWKNIRDSYAKSNKRTEATTDKGGKPYVYAWMMDFLEPILKKTKIAPNSSENENFLNMEVKVEEESNDSLTLLPSTSAAKRVQNNDTPVPNHSSYAPPPSKRLRRNSEKARLERLEEAILARLTAKPEEDADKMFVLSLLPKIRLLNSDQKDYLYTEFLQAIHRAKYFVQANYIQFQATIPH